MDSAEKVLKELAIRICNHRCGSDNGCPAWYNCDVRSDEACIDRIMTWLNEVYALPEDYEEE